MIRIQDLGEIGYGGVVQLAEWWDRKQVDEGKITDKDILKKVSTYTYLGIGGVATLMSAFGWVRRFETWTEHISHGFLYDLPRFAVNMVKSLRTTGGSYDAAKQAAIKHAQELIRSGANTKELAAGQGVVNEVTRHTVRSSMEI